MTIEEKAKAYDKAIETCKRVFNFNNLSYSHCQIKEKLEQIFPELAESEDERIRNLLRRIVITANDGDMQMLGDNDTKKCLDWLEKQKEQQLTEWSKEFLHLMGITVSQDGNQVCVLLGENLAEGIVGFGDTLTDAVEEFKKEWHQFDRFRKATWKPSEEQMAYLKEAINKFDFCDAENAGLQSLYDDLEKL